MIIRNWVYVLTMLFCLNDTLCQQSRQNLAYKRSKYENLVLFDIYTQTHFYETHKQAILFGRLFLANTFVKLASTASRFIYRGPYSTQDDHITFLDAMTFMEGSLP